MPTASDTHSPQAPRSSTFPVQTMLSAPPHIHVECRGSKTSLKPQGSQFTPLNSQITALSYLLEIYKATVIEISSLTGLPDCIAKKAIHSPHLTFAPLRVILEFPITFPLLFRWKPSQRIGFNIIWIIGKNWSHQHKTHRRIMLKGATTGLPL